MKQRKGSWKEKLEYFWMYKKVQALVVLAACIIAGHLLYVKLTEKPWALQVMLLDVHTDVPEGRLAEEFSAYAGIDRKKYGVFVSTSLLLSDTSSENYAMASLSKFQAMVGTQDLDICMMKEEDFVRYAGADAFLDLREAFSAEELEGFSECFSDSEGRVLGVYGACLGKIEEIGGYEGQKSVAGILYNSRRKETAAQFLRYLHAK